MSKLVDMCRALVPPLVGGHKGSSGRIGVFGGSVEFTGAPYFAGISALRTGADLVYVFSVSSAAPVIKSYSPELMVMPFLDSREALTLISPWLNRLHTILVGPGLGRDENTFHTITQVINKLKTIPSDYGGAKALVFDADGLFYLSRNGTVLRDYPGDVYITPNVVEFRNLVQTLIPENTSNLSDQDLCAHLCNTINPTLTIVRKGLTDMIYCNNQLLQCCAEGSNRRCGGQGDLLSGILAVFATWVSMRKSKRLNRLSPVFTDTALGAYSACLLTRTCNREAFSLKGRAMLATDMIAELPNVFRDVMENDCSK